MTDVTVAHLCRALPAALSSLTPATAPETPISSIHVSTLPDPTTYLDGGELLLTLTTAIPRSRAECHRYASRLKRAEVAALGVGGATTTVPPRLVQACADVGLSLLQVAPRTPFVIVSDAFWTAASTAEKQQLTATISAQEKLVRAAASPHATSGLVRVLADAVSGWATFLDDRARVRHVWPADHAHHAGLVSEQLRRTSPAGTHAAVTFPIGRDTVVVRTVTSDGQVAGHLAAGTPRPMLPTERSLVSLAGALVQLDATRSRQVHAASTSALSAAAHLLGIGKVSCARELAAWSGIPIPHELVRILVLDQVRPGSALRLVGLAWPEVQVIGEESGTTGWCIVPGGQAPDLRALRTVLANHSPGGRVLLGAPIQLEHVAPQRRWLLADLRARAEPVSSVDPPGGAMAETYAHQAHDLLSPLFDADRSELVETLARFLRHGGHWEPTARDLGVHRNTVRARIKRIEALLDVDLGDPDTSALAWLALRSTGLA